MYRILTPNGWVARWLSARTRPTIIGSQVRISGPNKINFSGQKHLSQSPLVIVTFIYINLIHIRRKLTHTVKKRSQKVGKLIFSH